MKKLFLLLICTGFVTDIIGNNPDTLTLDECLKAVTLRSPVARQKSVSDQMLSRKLANLKTNWLPNVGINAQANYNSETVEFSDLLENLPVSIPSLPLDQYRVWAEINQQIFDGGLVKNSREIEKAGYRAEIFQTESELHSLRMQVSQVYFSLLLTQNNYEILSSSLNLLTARKNSVKSGVDNGVILSENLLALEAEEISLQQKLTELRLHKSRLLTVLSVLTDSSISVSSVIATPVTLQTNHSGIRPEYLLFDQQKEKLQFHEKLVKSADLPKLFAFSQFAWGRPGYNIVSRDFHTFFTVGAGFKWNFLNYGDTKRQMRILELQKEMVDIKKSSFDDQLTIQLEAEATNIEKYDSLMIQDEQILRLRQEIAESSLSRLNHGTITSADYLEDMNDEIQARLMLENHRILRKQAEFNYLMLQGKLKYE